MALAHQRCHGTFGLGELCVEVRGALLEGLVHPLVRAPALARPQRAVAKHRHADWRALALVENAADVRGRAGPLQLLVDRRLHGDVQRLRGRLRRHAGWRNRGAVLLVGLGLAHTLRCRRGRVGLGVGTAQRGAHAAREDGRAGVPPLRPRCRRLPLCWRLRLRGLRLLRFLEIIREHRHGVGRDRNTAVQVEALQLVVVDLVTHV
mmetsp:Transcript_66784/g.186315  ORF Transcript_66784/g.186315 Transcript_66784/m.186315 type:complete len:206 (+) Transcript_66784:1295-1912(+)